MSLSDTQNRFQKYRLTHRISLGGMAEIYRAVLSGSEGFEKTVALKFLLPELAEDPEISQLFVEEARICSHLHHPNIVEVQDFGVFDERHFMAMEYVDGPNLKSILHALKKADRPFPLELAAFIVQQVARGLEYAHRATTSDGKPLALVHRDVSPQNILLSSQGDVKLTDFGIAKSVLQRSKTEAGTVKGKFRYMSPEQAKGQPVNAKSDQYSLGIVFYEALTGINIVSLKGPNAGELDQNLPPPSETRKDLPPGLELIILKMLSHNPESRYATCGEVALALANELRGRPEESLRNELAELIKQAAVRTPEGVFVTGGVTPNEFRTKKKPFRRFYMALLLISILGSIAVIFKYVRMTRLKPPAPKAVPALALPTSTPTPAPTSTPIQPKPTGTPKSRKIVHAESKPTAATIVEQAPVVAPPTAALSCIEGMIKIPGGAFYFGSEKSDADRNQIVEAEWQTVTLPTYCIDQYEFPNHAGILPKTNASWTQASELCVKGGKRLCSETEWENACKGPKNYRFPYGQDSDSALCNTRSKKSDPKLNGPSNISPPGKFTACKSGYEVFDMSGNAEEWVAETGRFERLSHIAKGGSAVLQNWAARCASLREYKSDTRLPTLGFRCCKDFP